ncbi:hypothetical protein EJB05_40534, partial [Eragrostis curvula]
MPYLTIMLLLALASLCAPRAAATDGSDGGVDLDPIRHERAAATIDELQAVHEGRQAVGVPPLTSSAQIAVYASASRSRGLVTARRCSTSARTTCRHWNATALAVAWVQKRQWYDNESNSCAAPPGAGCARYMQVVWPNTTQLGYARIVCDSGDTMLVCD